MGVTVLSLRDRPRATVSQAQAHFEGYFEYAKVSAPNCTTFILRRHNCYLAIVATAQPSAQEVELAQHLRALSLAQLLGLLPTSNQPGYSFILR